MFDYESCNTQISANILKLAESEKVDHFYPFFCNDTDQLISVI